jgi:hypothetical protein
VPDAGPLPDSPLAGPVETVTRPEPGTVARGAWEAPVWAFYVAAAFVVVAAVLYAAARMGLLRRRK